MLKKSTYLLIISILLAIGTLPIRAQQAEAFARVSVSPREGVVRQAYKVNISVHSSTWFTTPLQFSNLHIEDAFIIPFTRTVSSINYINKKKYATLTFYYLVFPYKTGNLEVPEITMTTSIPPEGGYKGEARTIKTRPQKIKVNPIPNNKDGQIVMVAKSANISEKWSKSTSNLKVGDVIERSITIKASGTLPSLISPMKIEEPKKVSIYSKAPQLQDKRNEDDVNGVRIETYSYLFEEEGEIILPAEEVVWWNPYNKRAYKRIIPEQKLIIAPNPDLALLRSLKDSLEAINAPVGISSTEAPYPWKRTIILTSLILLSLWIVFRITKREYRRTIEKRKAYLQSENFYFKQVTRAANNGETRLYIRKLYSWFDHIRPNKATLSSYLDEDDNKLLESIVKSLMEGTDEQFSKKELRTLSIKLRSNILLPEKNSEDKLNP